jgi:predicted ATP-grasp superfamily ATP-dependent carboligase
MWIAATPEELLQRYPFSAPGSDEVFEFSRPLIQQFIPGTVHDLCTLCRQGEPVASMTQRRLLMYPETGGGGILNETTWEPDLCEQGTALLRALDWHGPAQVEFKVDEATGETWLMEVNPRFWGTLDLAVQAGVNFPLLTAAVALEKPVGVTGKYEVGLRYRWPLPYGLLHAMMPGKRREAMRAFFLPQNEMRSDLRLDDPLPHIVEALSAARRIWRRKSLRPLGDLAGIPAGEAAHPFRGGGGCSP